MRIRRECIATHDKTVPNHRHALTAGGSPKYPAANRYGSWVRCQPSDRLDRAGGTLDSYRGTLREPIDCIRPTISVVDAVCGDNRREVKTGCVLKRSRVSGAKPELASEAANSACQTSPEVLCPCRVLGNVDPCVRGSNLS